jgi:alpha-tubulin suppressor-like RCC1 family protein
MMGTKRSLLFIGIFLTILIFTAVFISCKSDVSEDSIPDTFPPAVRSFRPSNAAKDIDISTSITVNFVEPVFTDTVSANTSDISCSNSIQVSKDEFTTCVKMVSGPSISSDQMIFTIQPSTNLDSNTTYKIKLTPGIKDLSGNVIKAAYLTSSGFKTLDIQWISSTSPFDGDVNVSITPSISVTFAQTMDTSTVSANITDTSCSSSLQVSKGNFSTCLQMTTDPVVSNNDQTFTVHSVSEFEGSTTYKIKITSAVIDATGGNGLLTDYITSTGFTTHETVPPVISSVCPPDGTSNVEFDTPIQITFNETIDTSTITTNASDTSCTGCIQISSDDFSTCVNMSSSPTAGVNDTAFLIKPASNLSSSTTYKIRVTVDAKDVVGNNMVAQYVSSSGFSTQPINVMNGFTQVSAGLNHTCALLNDGTIKCWGYGGYGQLGNGNTSNELYPVSVPGITTATQVSAGQYHSCARISDGTIQCWGSGGSGQLGNGSTSDRNIPVSVEFISSANQVSGGGGHTCALLDNGTINCWGWGDFGQLGNGSTADYSTPVNVSGISTATQISAGNVHSCALLSSGTIKCWGSGSDGKLGYGGSSNQSTPINVSGISTAIQVSAGYNHTCAVLNNGTIQCWGKGTSGQLGNGILLDQYTPVTVSSISSATQVSIGGYYTCAVLSDGTVKCWGDGSNGQLGNGSTSDQSIPVSVSGITTATQVFTWAYHSCALLAIQTIKCWGEGSAGQLGNGRTSNQNAPVDVLYLSEGFQCSGF